MAAAVTPVSLWRWASALAMVAGLAGSSRAQAVPRDTVNCDSIVAAASIDSVRAALYVDAKRADGDITRAQLDAIATAVATVFTPPRPFRLSVFSGPSEMRTLRRIGGDAGERRSPTVRGIYRFWTRRNGVAPPFVARASLTPGFDSSAVAAITDAGML